MTMTCCMSRVLCCRVQPSGLYYYLESKEATPEDAEDIDRLAIRDNLKLAVVRIHACLKPSRASHLP